MDENATFLLEEEQAALIFPTDDFGCALPDSKRPSPSTPPHSQDSAPVLLWMPRPLTAGVTAWSQVGGEGGQGSKEVCAVN